MPDAADVPQAFADADLAKATLHVKSAARLIGEIWACNVQ